MGRAEKFIEDCTRNCSNETDFPSYNGVNYQPWLTPDQALRAVEIEREELIEKAWEWIENNMLSSNQQDKSRLYFKQFVNYMEGE